MPVSRRVVLGAGAVTAAVALGWSPTAVAEVDEAAWQELRQALSPGAQLFRPGDHAYPAQAEADNLRYAAVRPDAVLACAEEADVQAALRWCAKH